MSLVRDQKTPYKYEAHSWGNLKGIPWRCCKHCGLLWLRNEFSDWCARMGCNADDSPQWNSMRKKAGKEDEDQQEEG